jgi:hypothetical protein
MAPDSFLFRERAGGSFIFSVSIHPQKGKGKSNPASHQGREQDVVASFGCELVATSDDIQQGFV